MKWLVWGDKQLISYRGERDVGSSFGQGSASFYPGPYAIVDDVTQARHRCPTLPFNLSTFQPFSLLTFLTT